MKNSFTRRAASALLVSLLLSAFHVAPQAGAAAQRRREHLTPEEIELVRDAQALDLRIGVFVKAAERRLLALSDPAASAKQAEKDVELWGEVKGTRAQLLSDVADILDEAITNIDDATLRSEKSPLIPKAMRKLTDASRRFLPQLTAMLEAAQDAPERSAVERAVEEVQEILDAANKHLTEEKKEEKKKS